MGLLFVVEYLREKILTGWFGISKYLVSKVLDDIFPIFVDCFSRFILNRN